MAKIARWPGLFCATAALACSGVALGQPADRHYAHGLPSDPSYFPIGVWLQSPFRARDYKAIGINLFVGLYEGPTREQLAELSRYEMPALAEQNDLALRSPLAGMIRGWIQQDEPDNSQPLAPGVWGPCIPAKEVAKKSQEIKAKDPTRPVFVNFGRGVADPSWRGRGSCSGDLGYYAVAVSGADIVSSDIYPVASNEPAEIGRLDLPSVAVSRLRSAAHEGQRVWTFIETTRIDSQHGANPNQLKSEVWLAIIRGANGLVYFVHEWTGGFREDGLFRHPGVVAAVTQINVAIASLAPALNAPTVEGRLNVTTNLPVATMLKQLDGLFYIFSGVTDNVAGRVSFALRDFSDGIAEVIGEDRTLLVSNGVFEDSFDGGYQVHIYRVRAN